LRGRVYTRRAGMRSRGDWKKRCRKTGSPAFDDAATNMAKNIATNFVDVDARYVFCLKRILRESVGLLIFIFMIQDSRFEVCCELLLSYILRVDRSRFKNVSSTFPQYSIANVCNNI